MTEETTKDREKNFDQAKQSKLALVDRKLIINPLYFLVVFIYIISRWEWTHWNAWKASAKILLRFRLIQWIAGAENFWSRSWNRVIDITGENPFNVYVVGTTVFSFAVYWIFGGMFTLMDLTLTPRALRRYKVQPQTNEPLDKRVLFSAIKTIVFNQIFVGIPLACIGYYLKKLKGFPENFREVPSFERVLVDLAVCILVDEIGFYYSHRLCHQSFLYKHVHKQHHLWQSPIAITAT